MLLWDINEGFLGGSFACLVWAKLEFQVWAWHLNPPTQLNAIDLSTGERADKRRVQGFMGCKKQIVVYLLQGTTRKGRPGHEEDLTQKYC